MYINNNKKLIYLFFDKTTRIEKNGETKIFPSGKYIATEGEYNKFELNKYREITLSFVHRIEINNADDSKQTFEQDKEYSMPKYKFDKLNLSKAQWAKLTLDCVLKNILELPFEAFNYLNNSALDRIGKIFFDDDYNKLVELQPKAFYYEKTNMPLYSEFFVCLISKLKYKTEYKDKFLELISFGGYKNYNGEYEFPAYENQYRLYWANKLELLRVIDPHFILDNLDNNLVQKYLKTAVSIQNRQQHKDCLKKIAEYSKNFHGNLNSEKDYLWKLVEVGLI